MHTLRKRRLRVNVHFALTHTSRFQIKYKQGKRVSWTHIRSQEAAMLPDLLEA